MNPTLYDILGVPQDATPDEIKRAWRDAAERFEPGSGGSAAQFRLFNEAAEVLLDPARRREYDAQLTAQRPAEKGPAEKAPAEKKPPAAKKAPAEKPQPEKDAAEKDAAEKDAAEKDAAEKDAAEKASAEAPRSPVPDTAAVAVAHEPEPGTGSASARNGAPRWLLVALGVLALVLVATAAWLGLNTYDIREVRRHDQVAEASRTAPAVAERAAAVILSYDYRTLNNDEKAAERYMTASYAKTYAKTFRLVLDNAPKLRAHVQATVRASGVSHADPDRANVLLFVDQSTVSTANGGERQTALNRVEMKMVRQNGAWVVNDITSY